MPLRRALLLLLALAATACASSKGAQAPAAPAPAAAEAPAAPAPPVDLATARARELPAQPKQRLAPPGGAFRGEVEGSGAPTYSQSEGVTQFEVPLPGTVALSCFVYENPIDAGGTLLAIVKAITGQENLTVRRTMPTGIVEVGGVPAVFLDVDYSVKAATGEAAGLAKLMVRPSDTQPLLCAHDDLGFAQTFRRITLDLAKSLQGPEGSPAPPAPRYAELQVVRLGQHALGFEWWEVRDAEGGGTRTDQTALLMMPRSATELGMLDTRAVFHDDARGQLASLEHVKAQDGEVRSHVKLSRAKAGSYTYEGTQDGKELQGTVQSKSGLTHELAAARAVKSRLLTGKARELTFDFYRPQPDPSKPSPITYRRAEGERALTVVTADATFSATVDAAGLVERAEVPLPGAPMPMVIERVYSQGAL